MPCEPSAAREFAHRLIVRESSERGGNVARADAAHVVCDRLTLGLRRWVGFEGTRALFARALADVRSEHTAVTSLRIELKDDGGLQGVPEAIKVHGAEAVATGLESMLAALFDLLGRLIGDDVTTTLVEQSLSVRESEKPGITEREPS